MANLSEGLSVRDLLVRAFSALEIQLNGRRILLPARTRAEIADDSDYHRTRKGYMQYESATVLKVGEKGWAVAFGTACGSYPADPYDCDISAVPFSHQGTLDDRAIAKICEALQRSGYFRSSLIYGMADGKLVIADNGFGKTVFNRLKTKTPKFITQPLVTDPRFFTLDMRPLVTAPLRYQEAFTQVLVDAFLAVLAA